MSYLSLQNQKPGSMKKPAITLKQPGINNVGIECICSKEHFWLQSIYVICILSQKEDF